jgi:hypothetical protein
MILTVHCRPVAECVAEKTPPTKGEPRLGCGAAEVGGSWALSRSPKSYDALNVPAAAGGSADKPVGTVWFAWATPDGLYSEMQRLDGDRAQVRSATVQHSLAVLLGLVQAAPAG